MKKFLQAPAFLLVCSLYLPAQVSGPVMHLSTAAVVVPSIAAGSTASSQVIQIHNDGTGTLNPTISSSATWVTASVGAAVACPSGTFTGNCRPLTLSFSTSALAVGSYTAFITVSDPSAIDSPQTVSVTLSVIAFASQTPLQLYAAPNGGTATATINTHSAVNAQASTASGGNWLSVSLPGIGSFGFYYPYQVKVTTQSGQGAGNYTGSIAISGSNTTSDNITVPVNLTVTTSPIAQLSATSVTLIGGVSTQPSTTVTVANAGEGSLSVTGATPTVSSGSGWLSAVVANGGGSVTITADTSSLAPGSYQGSVTLATNAVNNTSLIIPVSLLVTQQAGPLINVSGVVDNAVGRTPVAPGDIAAAYGSEFSSSGITFASVVPLPTTLGGVQVLVNNVAAPLYYTSTGQIDFQIPYETAVGTAVVQVVDNGTAGNKVSVPVVAREPKVLVFPGNVPIIIDYTSGKIPVNTTTLLPNLPALPGDTLVIYCIGLGQTTPAAVTGASPSSDPLQTVSTAVTVMLGGGFTQTLQLTPTFAGLAPGFVGLYQVNVLIPITYSPPASKIVPLTVSVAGATALSVNIAFQ